MGVTETTVVGAVRATAATGASLAVGGSALLATTGRSAFWLHEYLAPAAMISVWFGASAWMLIARQPRNRAVWVMAIGSTCGLYVAAYAALPFVYRGDPSSVLGTAPADVSAPVLTSMFASGIGWGVGFNTFLAFGLLLFPDGTLPSRRWRPLAWVAGGSTAAVLALYLYALRPSSSSQADSSLALQFFVGVHMLCAVGGAAAVIGRFRRSGGELRQQFKWIMWGGALFVVTFVAVVTLGDTAYEDLTVVAFPVGVGALIGSYVIAVGKFRLYDVDLVISRTLVYGVLGATITAGYVGAVVGFNWLVDGSGRPDRPAAMVTAGVIAFAFEPLRRRLQRLTDRLVYGRTATPAEVLSELSRRAIAADATLMHRVAKSLVDGTRVDHVSITLGTVGGATEVVEWPPAPSGGDQGTQMTIPILHDGSELGWLVLSMRPGEQVATDDLLLANRVASGLGLALHNRSLSSALEEQVQELHGSRRRLLLAQDGIRRRLEQDLHDGAQQQLVALKIKSGLARSIAEQDGAAATAAALHSVTDRTDAVIEAVRDFSRGLYPAMLDSEGLEAAVVAAARRLPIDARVCTGAVTRHEPAVEMTAYLGIVALLQAAAEAGTTTVDLDIGTTTGGLAFCLRGDRSHERDLSGAPAVVDAVERFAAFDGALEITSASTGWCAEGFVPSESRRMEVRV